jgi:hypothetical protein
MNRVILIRPKETIVIDAEEQAEEEAVTLSFDNYETLLEESQLVAASTTGAARASR